MKALRKLQQNMLATLLGKDNSLVLPNIKKMEGIERAQRLEIYRNSMREGLRKVMRDTYRICCKLVGTDFFDAMAGCYIDKVPSRSPDLGDYGADFSEFVGTFPPAASLPYLADVIALEWAWHCAYFGQSNEKVFDSVTLSNIPEENQGNIVLELPHASTLLVSEYPLLRIWEINQDDYVVEEGGTVDLSEGGVKLFIWRHGDDMRLDIISDAQQWEVLNQIQQGLPLCEWHALENAPEKVVALLQVLVSRGWVCGFHLK